MRKMLVFFFKIVNKSGALFVNKSLKLV